MSLFSTVAGVAGQTIMDIHGDEVTFTPAGGSPESIQVVLVLPEFLNEPDSRILLVLELQSSEPSQTPAKGDVFTVNSVEYRAFTVKEKYAGWLQIGLTK